MSVLEESNNPTTPDVASHLSKDDEAALLAFLQTHDVSCPFCRYSLHRLSQPRCPECNQPLELSVGISEMRMAWFLASIAPGIFSGLCGFFLLMPISYALITNSGPVPGGIILLDAFGLASGAFAITVMFRRVWFMKQTVENQRGIAITVWAAHVIALLILLAQTF